MIMTSEKKREFGAVVACIVMGHYEKFETESLFGSSVDLSGLRFLQISA